MGGWSRARIEKLASAAGRYYRPFDQQAAGKTKWRHIDQPTGEMLMLQRAIHRRILARVPLPPFMLGGVPKRSILDNARLHTKQPVLVTLDLKDFFPTVSDLAVFDTFRSRLDYVPELAGVLTKLTTLQHRLPQGAPTSTALANLVLIPMAERISSLARDLTLQMSDWVDDIALSGLRAHEAIGPAIRIVQAYGHSVAASKIKIMRHGREPQRVTGVGVDRGPSYGQRETRALRRQIYDLRSLGDAVPDCSLQSLWGKIRHVQRLRLSQGRPLAALAARLLPQHGVMNERPNSSLYRSCKRAHRHAVEARATRAAHSQQ